MAAKPKTDYFDLLAAWMRDNGKLNPREVPDSVVEALRREAGE